MDIAKIQSFLSYEPLFAEDPSFLLDSILERLPYVTTDQKQEVVRAYEFARLHH